MGPLIEITTIPFELQMTTKSASLEYKRGTVEMEISRSDNGGLDIKSSPIKLNVDTFEASNSLRPSTARSISQAAESGQNAAYKATAAYASQGELMLNAKVGEGGEVMTQLASDQLNDQIAPQQSDIAFVPNSDAQLNWEDGSMQIRYDMEKMKFDWKVEQGEFKFTPGDIEFKFKSGDVLVKYVGGPIYVPKSSDPNYRPVDVKA